MEVVVTSENSGQLWNFCVWDPLTGASLRVFKGGISAAHTLCTAGGDYLISAQKDKPILQTWAMNRQDQTVVRTVLPSAARALAVSPCGTYLVVGTGERLTVRCLSTGAQMALLRRHYRDVTLVRFHADSAGFYSAGEDGLVLSWRLESVLRGEQAGEPEHCWSDHALAVSDVAATESVVRPLVVSVSLDRTCKIRDALTGSVLLDLHFNEKLRSVCVDGAETTVFVGTDSGRIITVDLLDPPRGLRSTVEDGVSVAGGRFHGHTAAVTCLSASLDGTLLVSGSDDGSARVWNVRSGECVRVLAHRAPLTNAFFAPRFHHFAQDKLLPRLVVHAGAKKESDDAGVGLQAQVLVRRPALAEPCAGAVRSETTLQIGHDDQVTRLRRINHDIYRFAVEQVLKPRK